MIFALIGANAQAVVDLFQWGVNIDGTWEEPLTYPALFGDPLPAGMTGSLDTSGFGSLSTDLTGVGGHSIDLWLDFELENRYDKSY